jgi:hypothetical protein
LTLSQEEPVPNPKRAGCMAVFARTARSLGATRAGAGSPARAGAAGAAVPRRRVRRGIAARRDHITQVCTYVQSNRRIVPDIESDATWLQEDRRWNARPLTISIRNC